jgi:hypothetical protein
MPHFGRRRRSRPIVGVPSLVRFPRHPAALLATDAWLPLAQLADQRIRAHRGDRLDVGGLIEVVSSEIEEVLVDEPPDLLRSAWTAWDDEMRRIEGGVARSPTGADGVDDVAEALAVHTDLVALMPQLVVSRLSENVR